MQQTRNRLISEKSNLLSHKEKSQLNDEEIKLLNGLKKGLSNVERKISSIENEIKKQQIRNKLTYLKGQIGQMFRSLISLNYWSNKISTVVEEPYGLEQLFGDNQQEVVDSKVIEINTDNNFEEKIEIIPT